MSFGFEIFGEEGNLITDSDFTGYSLIQEGTVNLPATMTPVSFYFSTPVRSDSPPIVAVRLDTFNNASWVSIVRVMGSAGNWTHCTFTHRFFRPAISKSYAVRVYATEIESTDSMGIQVFNSAGKVTLDSGFKQLEFKDAGNWNPNWPMVISGDAPLGNNRETWIGFASDIYLGDSAWIPLSLTSMSFTITHNAPNGIRPAEVQGSWVNFQGYLTIVFALYAQYAVVGFSIQFNTFCPVILD